MLLQDLFKTLARHARHAMEQRLRDEPVPPGTLEPGHETILADILKVQQSRLLCVFPFVVGQRYCLTGKKSSMAMQNGSGVLWERAKELLRKEDYERLKIAIKTFSKTRSLEGLCSDLLKIVNSRSKVDLLTEVRSCLPKNQRNTFTRRCNELLSEAALERGDLEKKRKMEAKELDRENRAGNFQGSPAKKTKQNSEKPPSSRSEKKELQESNQPISDGSKESQTLANKVRKIADRLDTVKHILDPHEEYKTVALERKSLNQEFGFKIRGGTFHQPVITVAQVAKDSLADRQGLKTGDKIVRVDNQRCGRGGVVIAQVIGIIKAAEKIHMRIVSGRFPSKDECDVHGKRNKLQTVVDARAEETEQNRLSVVCVYPNEDGWLGCCIRGYVLCYLRACFT